MQLYIHVVVFQFIITYLTFLMVHNYQMKLNLKKIQELLLEAASGCNLAWGRTNK